MRSFRRVLWAAATLTATSVPALAQQQTPGGSGGNVGSAPTQIQSLPTTTSTASPQSSTSTDSGGSGSTTTEQSQFELAAIKQPPSKTNTNNTAINTSNFLRNSYGSVYYQGADRMQVPNRNPGSFGTAIYPATGTSAAGGRGTQGNRGGSALTDPGGQIVQLPRQIAYASQIQFKTPAGNPVPQLQSDLRSAIDRVPTNMLTNPAGVQVNVDGRNVTLKGAVKDEEEARLVEGMVRLTPGVFDIKNELTFAK